MFFGMAIFNFAANQQIAQVPKKDWMPELEKASQRYHLIACWVAIIFDPVFAVTDFINIPQHAPLLLAIRLAVSWIILCGLILGQRWKWSTHVIVSIPFITISFQNAFTYSLISTDNLLGHSLNYMALLVGAAMFVLWPWVYSLIIVLISIVATAFFVLTNPFLSWDEFLLNGGLLLFMVALFMMILIQTRYNLSIREIKARIALAKSKEEIRSQGEEIRSINENLEFLVLKRTIELERKNKALEEYAFINAHKLRSPVASLLGLISLLSKTELTKEAEPIVGHMVKSGDTLDDVVRSITKAIEKAEKEPDRKELPGRD
jgi:signal transduction histidine kinase